MDDMILTKQQTSQLAVHDESRALSEIKGKIFLAKQFPRDEEGALSKILKECKQKRVAENAVYEYSRGTSAVRGASIRLAEVVARHWGNIDCGVVEVEQRSGESTMKAYAWDLESNYRDEKIFSVKHVRSTKKGDYAVTDPRDIYELTANNAARRKRACILAVIPGYVFDAALEECEKTLEGAQEKQGTIEERRDKMFAAFKVLKPDATKEQIGAVVNKEFDKISAKDLVKLGNLYNAIKDGFVKVNVALGLETEDAPATEEDAELDALNERFGANG